MPKLGDEIKNAASQAANPNPKKPKKKGRIKNFFKGVWAELKKVHWPSKKQLVTYTGVVILAVVVLAGAISLFDFLLSKPIEWALSL